MNNVILIGRATIDPELKYIPTTGTAFSNFSIAVDRDYKGKDEKKQTDFFNIVIYGKTAEYAANYLRKGKLVAIKGSIQNRSYETKEKEKKYITEIIAQNIQILEWDKNSNIKPDQEFTEATIDESDVPF